jgi:hypothetical protein
MNELDLLRRLGARTCGEVEPRIDVAARVIQRIARRRNRVIDPRLALVSVCACALSALATAGTRPAKPANDTLAALSEAAFNSTGPDALLRVLEP